MEHERHPGDVPTLRDYLGVLKRRRAVVLLAVLILPLSGLLFALSEPKLYSASAKVAITRDDLATQLTGGSSSSNRGDPARLIQTQAAVAQSPNVIERVLAATGRQNGSVNDLLSRSSVMPNPDADLLVFEVTERDPKRAVRVATAYAREYTRYALELKIDAIRTARAHIDEQLRALRQSRDANAAVYADLAAKDQELRAAEVLETGDAVVIAPAYEATQVQPKPVRTVLLGLGIGGILGVVLAFIWEALDTRVRSVDEVARILRLPLLARIPRRRRQAGRSASGSLDLSAGPDAEAFLVLRTSLELAELDRDIGSLLFTSALENEDKSTTVANLAVAMARRGRRVILVDLDVRAPSVAGLFGIDGEPGVTDVVLGRASLEDAITNVALDSGERERGGSHDRDGDAAAGAVLGVLSAGTQPLGIGDFIASSRIRGVLSELRERADLVLVDAPSVLAVSDTLAIAADVDAIVLVARIGYVRSGALEEALRVLERTRTPILGFVATSVDRVRDYGDGGARRSRRGNLSHAGSRAFTADSTADDEGSRTTAPD